MRNASILAAVLVLALSACQSSTNPDGSEMTMEQKVADAIAHFKSRDPGLARWFDSAHGYAVFPSIAKGGVVVGGAGGDGLVYEKGALIGKAELSQGTIGLQLGGQSFREVVFFKDKAALDQFTSGTFQFAANASAVAVEAGASTAADYSNGVAVFTMTKAGLMFEATVGGQQFDFERM